MSGNKEQTRIHHLNSKALFPWENFCSIRTYLQYVSLPHHLNSLEWEQKPYHQTVSQLDLSENWNIFRQNYSRFPSEACWSFSPCPAEGCGSWLNSRCVPENIPENKKEEKQAITSPISPLNNCSHSSVQPPVQKPHLNKQTLQCAGIKLQPNVRCLFTWTLDHGSPGSATIFTLRQTGPGSNQAISTACCHSLSSSFHNSHIRFLFYRDWYDKTHNGHDRHQNVQRPVNVIYLTFTLNRKEGWRNEVPSEVLFSAKP